MNIVAAHFYIYKGIYNLSNTNIKKIFEEIIFKIIIFDI